MEVDFTPVNWAPPKSNWALPISEPPFTAFPVTCGITFTFGGLLLGSILYSLPFAVQPLQNAFEAVGRRALDDSRDDLRRVKALIDKVGYRGYLPIETLGPGHYRAHLDLARLREDEGDRAHGVDAV